LINAFEPFRSNQILLSKKKDLTKFSIIKKHNIKKLLIKQTIHTVGLLLTKLQRSCNDDWIL